MVDGVLAALAQQGFIERDRRRRGLAPPARRHRRRRCSSRCSRRRRSRPSSATTWRSRCCCRPAAARSRQTALEQRCQLMAQRMTMLYGFNSPEFFDRSLFRRLHRPAAQPRRDPRQDAEGRLEFDEVLRRASPTTRSSCSTSRSATASCRSRMLKRSPFALQSGALLYPRKIPHGPVLGRFMTGHSTRFAGRCRDLRAGQRPGNRLHQPSGTVTAAGIPRCRYGQAWRDRGSRSATHRHRRRRLRPLAEHRRRQPQLPRTISSAAPSRR